MRAMLDRSKPEDFGANSWLVEEMYERFREDPNSVGDTWKDFFSDFKPAGTPKVDSTAEIIRPALPPELREESFRTESQNLCVVFRLQLQRTWKRASRFLPQPVSAMCQPSCWK